VLRLATTGLERNARRRPGSDWAAAVVALPGSQ